MQKGESPVYRALTPNDDERLIREFVLQLKLGHVSRNYFKQKFGVEPAERFAAPLQRRLRGFAKSSAPLRRIGMRRSTPRVRALSGRLVSVSLM